MCIRDRWNRPAAGWESHAIPASVLETCPAYSEGKAACRAALAVAGTQPVRPISQAQVMKPALTRSPLSGLAPRRDGRDGESAYQRAEKESRGEKPTEPLR